MGGLLQVDTSPLGVTFYSQCCTSPASVCWLVGLEGQESLHGWCHAWRQQRQRVSCMLTSALCPAACRLLPVRHPSQANSVQRPTALSCLALLCPFLQAARRLEPQQPPAVPWMQQQAPAAAAGAVAREQQPLAAARPRPLMRLLLPLLGVAQAAASVPQRRLSAAARRQQRLLQLLTLFGTRRPSRWVG